MHERTKVVDNLWINKNSYMAYIQSFQNKEIGDIFKSYLTVLKKGGVVRNLVILTKKLPS